MHPILNIAIRAARRAGSIINRAALDGVLKVRSKRVNDFATQVDDAAEQAIIDVVRKAYPDHGFHAEESGITAPDAEHVWIIDPIDGTTNFIHGFPFYCVSIALAVRGQILDRAPVAAIPRDGPMATTRTARRPGLLRFDDHAVRRRGQPGELHVHARRIGRCRNNRSRNSYRSRK